MPNINLINGTILSLEEMPDKDTLDLSEEEAEWYASDLREMSTVPCRFDSVPERIDLLFIDGGEYCGEKEFGKLMGRSRIIVLDDTRTIKSRRARKHLLYNRSFRKIFDDLGCGNGACGFERQERERSVFSTIPVFLSTSLSWLVFRVKRLLA